MKSNHCFHGAKEDAKQRSRPRRHALFMALHRVGLSFSLPHQIKAFFVIFSFHSNATFLSQKFRPRVLPLTLPGLPDCWKHCMMTLGCTDLQRNQKTRLSFQWEIWKKRQKQKPVLPSKSWELNVISSMVASVICWARSYQDFTTRTRGE